MKIVCNYVSSQFSLIFLIFPIKKEVSGLCSWLAFPHPHFSDCPSIRVRQETLHVLTVLSEIHEAEPLSHEQIFEKTEAAKLNHEWKITLTKVAALVQEGLMTKATKTVETC